jgi:hypothetical protein
MFFPILQLVDPLLPLEQNNPASWLMKLVNEDKYMADQSADHIDFNDHRLTLREKLALVTGVDRLW